MKAELLALWCSVKLANLLGFPRLKIFGDSRVTIKWAKGEYRLNITALTHWCNRIRDEIGKIKNIVFEHIYREHNQMADKMSKQALTGFDGYLHWEEYFDENKIITISMTLLDEALAFQGSKMLQPGKVVLIKDCVATSGAFILHYLIKKMLMGSSEIAVWPKARAQKVSPTVGVVLFIGLNEPFVHYERILRKLACNLLAYRDNGQFIFMDMLQPDYTGGGVTKTENVLFELYKSIHQTLQECISSEKKTGGVCIMIDDLSLLEIVAHGSEDHVLDFLHYCRILTSEQGCSLVLLSHQDIYASMDNSSFIRHLEYFADIVIDVEPLNSGLAADVHGQLTVLHRSSHEDISNIGSGPRNTLHNFHFRVKENQVEYFLPGKQF